MMKLKEGDVVLFKDNGTLYSKAIKWATNCLYTHTGIILSIPGNGLILIAEAVERGFVIGMYDEEIFYKELNDKYMIRRANKELNRSPKYIRKYIGREYAWQDIFKIAVHILTGKILFKGSAKELICSEAVTRALYDMSNKQINFETEFNKSFDYITPKDIMNSKQLNTIQYHF